MRLAKGPVRAVVLAALICAWLLPLSGPAVAAPTAGFTFAPTAPAVGQSVHFTFTGSCDLPPCRIQWRWFKTPGSSTGTSMGEGNEIDYTFLSSGSYSVVAKITNSSPTHTSASATHGIIVRLTLQDYDRRITYDGWSGAADVAAVEGGYRSATRVGSAAQLRFSGTFITYIARTGPDRGIARLIVDGTQRALVNLYAPVRGQTSRTVSGLSSGAHVVKVSVTGAKSALSSGTSVTLDAFATASGRLDDRSSRIMYDAWSGAFNTAADAGSYRVSSRLGSTTSITFTGRSVTWRTFKGPQQGIATVMLDGRLVSTVDNYAASPTWKVGRTYVSLTSATHTLTIRVAGQHNVSSTGNNVVVDAFVIY